MTIRNARHMVIPDIFSVRVRAPASAAVIPWWLAGGVSAANCIAAYQPIGAADLAASYVNLANPGTYNAAPGSAPSFNTATGWTSNGTQYLLTGIAMNSPCSIILRGKGNGSGVNCAFCSNAAPYDVVSIIKLYTEKAGFSWRGAVPSTTSVALTTHVLAMCGGGVNALCYVDGTYEATTPGGAAHSNPLRICGSGTNGNVTIAAIAIYNATLTADQVAAITAAMAALT